MAEAYQVYKKPNTGGLIVAAIVGLGGVGLIYLASKSSGGVAGPTNRGCLLPGEQLSNPACAQLETSPGIHVDANTNIDVPQPTIYYSGPGRDVFTAARVVQDQGYDPVRDVQRGLVTVMGSGIAGIHLPASPTLKLFALVPTPTPTQYGGVLTMYPFRGHSLSSNPICGWDAYPGPATLVIEVFGVCDTRDGDGYASTTCNNRQPIAKKEYAGKVVFV